MSKSSVTNLIAAALIALGYALNASGYPLKSQLVLTIGLFSLSGALTNWLAVHMLFEKVPGLYGSGVIPARFEDFKKGIHSLIMDQFFTDENLRKFFQGSSNEDSVGGINFAPIIDNTDLTSAFDNMITMIMESSFGAMLNMVGGNKALERLREPFTSSLRDSLHSISHSKEFQKAIVDEMGASLSHEDMKKKVAEIVDARLNELTPDMVKEIIQKMIKEHLGWLVVWGGVFGAIIGGIAPFLNIN